MKRINHLLKIILLGVGLGLAQGASATPIGPGSEPALVTEGKPISAGFLFGWFVGDERFNPITISADPGAGFWGKLLPFLGLIGPGNDPIPQGTQFVLIEPVEVGEGPPWRDWHETILTPGWGWGTFQDGISLPNIFAGLTVEPIPGLEFSIDNPAFEFKFDPLNPGAVITIVKILECTDSSGCSVSSEPFPGYIAVAEYPSIPEPTTLALLALGLAGLGFSRRKLN